MVRVTVRLPEDLHERLCTASRRSRASLNQVIVHALTRAMERGEVAEHEESDLAEQVRHIREVLGDLCVELDFEDFPPHLPPRGDLPDREEFARSLPKLDPPLSWTLIADREDRFYPLRWARAISAAALP